MECADDGGPVAGEFAKLVNRSGPVSTFRTTDMKWSELRTRKRQLASAYFSESGGWLYAGFTVEKE